MKAPLGPERRRFKVLGATRYVSSITSSYDGCQGKQDHHSKDRPRFYGELNGNLPDIKPTRPAGFAPNLICNSALGRTSHKARNGVHSVTCRNRHCPRCQATAARRWLEAREADLLHVGYYHVVFTLPAAIS